MCVSPWLFQAYVEAEHYRRDHVTADAYVMVARRREKGQERSRIHSLRIPFRAAPLMSLPLLASLLKVLLLDCTTG